MDRQRPDDFIYFDSEVQGLRISAIVDACFRLIVDGRFSAIVDAREVRASERVNVSQSSTISLKRTVAKRFLEV